MDTPARTAAALGVDFGTHHTVATVLRGDGRRHQLLFDGSPLLPSGIYLGTDVILQVGRDAAREGRLRPERYERNPKLRLGAATILLGDQEIPVREAVGAVLRRVIGECGAVVGAPRSVTVTVPAGWGPARRHVIADAAVAAGAASPLLLPEPVAAARYFTEVLGQEIASGRAVVVFDLGAGTFDASAVARTDTGYEVLAVDGSDRIGGHYLDQALVEYLGGRYIGERADQWRSLMDPGAGSERLRQRFVLYDEVREAKERLSRGTTTEVAVPGFANDELLTRSELELLARPLLARAVAITKAVIREAGLGPEQVAGVFMVGGASRMPLAATMIHQELGIAPTLIEQPELVVAEGAVTAPPSPRTPAAVPPAGPVGSAALAGAPPLTPTPAVSTPVPTPEPHMPAAAAASGPGPASAPPTGLPPTAAAPPGSRPDRSRRIAAGIVAVVLVLLAAGGWLLGDVANPFRDEGRIERSPTGGPASSAASEEPTADPSGGAAAEWADVAVVEVQESVTAITVVTNAAPAMEDCAVDYRGAGQEAFGVPVACDRFTLDGLWASDVYSIELRGPDASQDGIDVAGSTEAVLGEVYWDCPQSRQYCRDQGGEPGVRAEAGDPGSAIGTVAVGEVLELNCYEVAETIVPRGEEAEGFWDYHEGKEASDLMIRVEWDGGVGYVPFVWLVVDPGDVNALGGLGPC